MLSGRSKGLLLVIAGNLIALAVFAVAMLGSRKFQNWFPDGIVWLSGPMIGVGSCFRLQAKRPILFGLLLGIPIQIAILIAMIQFIK